MSDMLSPKLDEAEKLGARLDKRNAAVESAKQARDDALYDLLALLHRIERRLSRQANRVPIRKALNTGGLPLAPDWASLLLKRTYPSLSAKARSKYAAVMRYVRAKKKPGQKVMDFVRENGGLNGCVEKEKKLRQTRQKMSG